MHEEKTRGKIVDSSDLVQSRIALDQSDLLISSEKDISLQAEKIVKQLRLDLSKHIIRHPKFETSFVPIKVSVGAPEIIRVMAQMSKRCSVGSMSSVAGAMVEFAGKKLLRFSRELIIENGESIFLSSKTPRSVLIHAGESPFSKKIALEIDPKDTPIGIRASSAKVKYPLNFGFPDAVVILSKSAALADAAATTIGNAVKKQEDIEDALARAKKIKGLKGVLIIKGDKMGICGKIKIVKI